MANWSSDTYYFGRATPAGKWGHVEVQQDIMRLLTFNDHEHPYIIDCIKLIGPAVSFSGSGKWGCGCPVPDSVWDTLRDDIVVCEGTNGFDDDYHRTVAVAGEQVFLETLKIWDSKPFSKYMGTNPDEQHFFKTLWHALDQQQEERFQREAFLLLPESERRDLRAAVDAKYQIQSDEGWRHFIEYTTEDSKGRAVPHD